MQRYDKNYIKKAQEEIEENKIETEFVEDQITNDHEELVDGVVSCYMLNVRELPSSDSEIVNIISRNSKVKINVAESTSDFYKVYTENGMVGFCMKDFIKL